MQESHSALQTRPARSAGSEDENLTTLISRDPTGMFPPAQSKLSGTDATHTRWESNSEVLRGEMQPLNFLQVLQAPQVSQIAPCVQSCRQDLKARMEQLCVQASLSTCGGSVEGYLAQCRMQCQALGRMRQSDLTLQTRPAPSSSSARG